MSKMQCIEGIIFKILADGEWHMITEIRAKIMEQDESLLENTNYLSVILNRLKNQKETIELKEKGLYRMKQNESVDSQERECNDMNEYREKILTCWREVYERNNSNNTPSYEMTEKQFKEGKWLYELNKEMEKLILLFEYEEKMSVSDD